MYVLYIAVLQRYIPPLAACDTLRILPVLWTTLYQHIAANNGRRDNGVYSTWVRRGQYGFDTAANTQTDPLGGSTGLGAESDIYVYDCPDDTGRTVCGVDVKTFFIMVAFFTFF